MTAPDPRPYAAPTDLVTAEDVARWLREWRSTATDRELIAAVDWIHAYEVQDLRNAHDLAQELASQALDARLDRERRQACRRGCFAHFRDACVHRQNERALFPMLEPEWATTAGECRRESIHRALAFRAAARQP
ncbi:MAG TPA: hypothetical protein PK141_00475 [Polyangiaceae bacterium]|nr:hypothetical protein [Polyangiaceae bacterium]